MSKEKQITGVQNQEPEQPEEEIREVLAGIKVQHQSGGPEMVLVGFTTENGYFLSKETYEQDIDKSAPMPIRKHQILYNELSKEQQHKLAAKIAFSKEGCGFYQSQQSQTFYQNTRWQGENLYSKQTYYCLCRYWSNQEGIFKYSLFLPYELIIIS